MLQHIPNMTQLKVVHNNYPRGNLLAASMTLKSTLSQRFSAVQNLIGYSEILEKCSPLVMYEKWS